MTGKICPTTQTCSTHSFGDYTFECGDYSIADSKKIRSYATVCSDILGKSIDGKPMVTIIPNVTDKIRMRSEDFSGLAQWKAPYETGELHECKPFQAQKLKKPRIDNRWLHVFPMNMEYALCLPELLPTFLRNLRSDKGFASRWKDRGLVNWFIEEVLTKDAAKQIKELVINGDYKSPIKKWSQFDGIRKMMHLLDDSYKPTVVKIKLPTLAEGDYLHFAIGGQVGVVPFNTDQATTITDAILWMNELKQQSGEESLYSVTTNSNDCIWVTEKVAGCGVDVMAFVNQSEFFNYHNESEKCGNGVIVQTVQQSKNLHAPIVDKFGKITKENYLDWVCYCAHLESLFEEREGADASKLVYFISRELARTIRLARIHLMKCCPGDNKEFKSLLDKTYCVDTNLKGSEYFATIPGNIQMGTDLKSDFTNVSTHYDWKCKSVLFRIEAAVGMNIHQPSNVITNMPCMPYNFQPPAKAHANQFCIPDCAPGCSPQLCSDCTASFDWHVEVNEETGASSVVIKNTSDCDPSATYNYSIYVTDPEGASAEFALESADGSLPFDSLDALDGMNVKIEQVVTTSDKNCAPLTCKKGDTININDAVTAESK